MPGFRVNAVTLFLTWSRTDFDITECIDWLVDKEPTLSLIRIASEHHEDGALHRHAILRFKRKRDIRDPRHFDFAKTHCNIKPISGKNGFIKSWRYLEKENNFIDWPANNADTGKDPTTVDSTDLVGTASTLEYADWLQFVHDNNVQWGLAQAVWKHATTPPIFDILDGNVLFGPYPECFARVPPNLTVLVLEGASLLGKTQFAKVYCRKPGLFVRHVDTLKLFNPNYHKSLVFDDMCFGMWPIQSQIHLLDTEEPSAIHIRYGTVTIPANTQKIFSINPGQPIFSVFPAIQRRYVKICLDNYPLFSMHSL